MSPALHPAHLEDLRKSGLTEDDVREAAIYSARPGDIEKLTGRNIPNSGTSALVFSYYGCDDFTRVKLFPPLVEADGTVRRYLQRKGTGCRLYIPPAVAPALADATEPLAFVEGEKKTLAVCKAGWPAVGIGGIWNFATDGGLIPDIKAILLKGRIFRIIPDGETWQREDLLPAVFRFGRLLEDEGGTVFIVRLPILGGEKTGADDFIVAKGPAAFRRLVANAVTLAHTAFKPWRAQEKAKARQAEKAAKPLPPELIGRRIHPALHFDPDGFAAVGILNGGTWRTVTSDGIEYPSEALKDILTPDPATYPALGERWEARAAFVKRESASPSWAEAVATALAVFRDFVEHDEDAPYAVCALWTVGTYIYPALPSYPRLNMHGEKGSGKSKTLKLIAALAHNGLWRTAPRAAPLFRLIETLRPTLCLDELEHLDREDRGDIAAIANAGYQAGGAVDRCDPLTFNPRPFAVYAPLALAGIKGLNAVLADRCITIIMQPGRDRNCINRDVDLSNPDPRIGIVHDLCYRLALTRWREARAAWERLALPTWLNGRSRELWAPLLALAELVAIEAPKLDLRPSLLALARPDAEDRAELPEVAAAILTALEGKLGGTDPVTIIQPGELAEDVKAALGQEVTPTVIGLRLKALGFKRDRQRKGGSWYSVTADAIQSIRDRRELAEEPTPVDPPVR